MEANWNDDLPERSKNPRDKYAENCSDDVEILLLDGRIFEGYFNFHVSRWFVYGFNGRNPIVKSWRNISN